jgi:uncharacterized protein (DUF983 family)
MEVNTCKICGYEYRHTDDGDTDAVAHTLMHYRAAVMELNQAIRVSLQYQPNAVLEARLAEFKAKYGEWFR